MACTVVLAAGLPVCLRFFDLITSNNRGFIVFTRKHTKNSGDREELEAGKARVDRPLTLLFCFFENSQKFVKQKRAQRRARF